MAWQEKACAEALGRATVDHDRVCAALAAALRAPLPYDEWNERSEAVYGQHMVARTSSTEPESWELGGDLPVA